MKAIIIVLIICITIALVVFICEVGESEIVSRLVENVSNYKKLKKLEEEMIENKNILLRIEKNMTAGACDTMRLMIDPNGELEGDEDE